MALYGGAQRFVGVIIVRNIQRYVKRIVYGIRQRAGCGGLQADDHVLCAFNDVIVLYKHGDICIVLIGRDHQRAAQGGVINTGGSSAAYLYSVGYRNIIAGLERTCQLHAEGARCGRLCAVGLAGGGDAQVRIAALSQPEVGDLRCAVRRDQDIGRFEVAMNDPLLMGGVDGISQHLNQLGSTAGRRKPFANLLSEAGSLNQFH
jgi:hypothetical protein